MLQLIVGSDQEFFNESSGEFITIKLQKLTLEHSLLSISKWESKWKKSFFSEEEMSPTMFKDYIRCMTVTPNINPLVYECLTYKNLEEIRNYMKDSMTATVIRHTNNSSGKSKKITSELVYYWMFALGIPIECEKWHFNRLMTLIEVASIESNPKKKRMGRREIYAQNAELNRKRRAMHNTKG